MGEDDTTPKMLNSTISPPIFVDSRKSARDSQVLLEKKMSSFVEPFLPENLEKIFIKRENKRKNDIEIQIYNDVDGLFNYLTAPNIRHKVKHPLFLSLKFSKCVKLYYNSKVILNESLEELIDFLQKQLCEDHRSKKPQAAGPTTYSNETRVFLLLFEETGDSFKTKKIIEAVEPIQSTSFGLLYSKNQLPENFIEVTNIPEMIAIYRRNFANLFSASKIRRQSNLDKDDSEEESNAKSGSESSSEEEEEINPIPKKKVKSNIESCQNLAGLENNSIIQSAGLKDPFSLLKEKNEGNLNLLSIPENKDETPEKSLETETISKAKNIETEEDKNPIEPNKPETIKKQAEINKSSLNDSLGINKPTNQQANNIPNIANIPSNFMPNVNNPNANLLSFMDTLNRGPSMPQNNQNLMNPFNNPAVLALLANSQNPLNMLNQQKNLANMLNPQPSMTNAQERELMKNMQKNNGNNMSNFGMNFNNYAILNSLLMNQGLNAPGQFNLFDGLFGNMSNQSLNIPEPTQKNTTNPIGNRPNTNNTANSGNNNNNNANWNPNINNNQNNKQANDPFLQMNLNNLMMKNQTAFQNVPNNNNNNGNNNNNNNSQSDNNYLKNLLIQALKNGNANPSQLLNIASMLGKGNENNGGIMKEEEK